MLNHKNKITKLFYYFCLIFILLPINIAMAHPGRTDANGGHYVTATGEYHYHHGYPAHDHINGICPYEKTAVSNSNTNNSSGISNNGNGNLSSDNHLTFFMYVVGGILVLWCLKSWHNSYKKKKQFEKEKLYYSTLYNGKSIKELANVPKNIDFDENDLPISIDDSELKWGKEFTVFATRNGSSYHRNRGCSGAYNPVHIFKKSNNYWATGCKKCASGKNLHIPDWYNNYLEIKRIKKHYGI